jgi:hypothetical protein
VKKENVASVAHHTSEKIVIVVVKRVNGIRSMKSNQVNMRKVEAKALIQELEKRDPFCIHLLVRAMELMIMAHPGLGAKDFLAMMLVILPNTGSNRRQKEFFCPNLNDDSPDQPEPDGINSASEFPSIYEKPCTSPLEFEPY